MHTLFTTEVYQAKLKFDLKDLKKEILKIREIDNQGQLWSQKNYPHGYTSYSSLDRLHQFSSTFSDLQKIIDQHAKKYVKSLAYDTKKSSLKLNSMWVNIMSKGAFHGSHLHPHSVLSGTFYVDVPNGSSALKFEDPRLSNFMNSPGIKATAKASKQRFVSISPKASDVILFESWLKHEVPQNTGLKDRISISFNYGW